MLEGVCLFTTEAVTVVRRVRAGSDAFGGPVWAEEAEEVAGVLFAPTSASDLDASRPEGSRARATFHFPRGYAGRLKGCSVVRAGRAWRVVGDPQPYMDANTPGAFCLSAECEAVDG